MKERFFSVVWLLLFATAVSAATYNITIVTNPAAENRLTRARLILNGQGMSYANNDAVVQDLCPSLVTAKVNDLARNALAQSVSRAAESGDATPAQLDAMCAAAGKTIVAGLCQ